MKATIISIGNEIISGSTTDTNSAFLSRLLFEASVRVVAHLSLPDDVAQVSGAIKSACRGSDLVVLTGGLGPTHDDITFEAVAAAAGRELRRNRKALVWLKGFFRRRRVEMVEANLKQCMLPRGGVPLKNPLGTAPGLLMKWGKGKSVFVFPGVPREMEAMAQKYLLPFVKKRARGGAVVSRLIRTSGAGESWLAEELKDIVRENEDLTIGFYAKPQRVDLRITARAWNRRDAAGTVSELERKICGTLGDTVYGFDSQTLESVVAGLLSELDVKVAVAESCTAGMLGSSLTVTAGSSKFFLGGVIAYSDMLKKKLLGVPEEVLRKSGAVSRQTALRMAVGAVKVTGADIGISITGIAGPSGGTKKKPVGLVYIALFSNGAGECREFRFHGSRSLVRERSTVTALDMLRRFLLERKRSVRAGLKPAPTIGRV